MAGRGVELREWNARPRSGPGQQNGPLHGAAGQSNREVQAAWRRLPAVS